MRSAETKCWAVSSLQLCRVFLASSPSSWPLRPPGTVSAAGSGLGSSGSWPLSLASHTGSRWANYTHTWHTHTHSYKHKNTHALAILARAHASIHRAYGSLLISGTLLIDVELCGGLFPDFLCAYVCVCTFVLCDYIWPWKDGSDEGKFVCQCSLAHKRLDLDLEFVFRC